MAVDRFLVSNLLKLNGLDEFRPFKSWLEQQREYWRDALETQTDEVLMRQAQGRARAYKEILDMMEKAPELARKVGNEVL